MERESATSHSAHLEQSPSGRMSELERSSGTTTRSVGPVGAREAASTEQSVIEEVEDSTTNGLPVEETRSVDTV